MSLLAGEDDDTMQDELSLGMMNEMGEFLGLYYTQFSVYYSSSNFDLYFLLPNGSVQIFGGPKKVNVSHVIHDLSFGPKYPGLHNPLDETSRIVHDGSGKFKYYIKV